MANFTPITTQEQFNAAIEDRLKKERELLGEKYEGYLSPDDVKKKYEGYLSPDDEEKKYKGYLSPEEAEKKDAKIRKYESDSVKVRIAGEMGIPYELAARLSGEDETAIRKDAENISKLLGQVAPPLKNTEANGTDVKTLAMKSMLSDLKGE